MPDEPVQVSIVVPVLNEAPRVARLLEPLQGLRGPRLEVLVADGGSEDSTVVIARPLADVVLATKPGRATQMNAGAARASGEVLVFLHADTTFDASHLNALRDTWARAPVAVWGRFDVRIHGRPWMLRVVAACMNLRSRLTGIATGDQVMFVRRQSFEALGGFPAQPLMEDIELSGQLTRLARPLCIGAPAVVTSGRRWEKHGVWRTIVLMWQLRARYALGASPDALAQSYRRHDR